MFVYFHSDKDDTNIFRLHRIYPIVVKVVCQVAVTSFEQVVFYTVLVLHYFGYVVHIVFFLFRKIKSIFD